MDISVLLKIYGYEYEYIKFSWILSMVSPTERAETARPEELSKMINSKCHPGWAFFRAGIAISFNCTYNQILAIPIADILSIEH